MDGYLLDTVIASWAWDGNHPQHTFVHERLADIPSDLIFISPITLAEVEYGLQLKPDIDDVRKDAIRRAMRSYQVVPVDRHTGEPYARIKTVLFHNHSPRDARGKLKLRYVEDLKDLVTGKALGIQENDLWIVAVAVQYNLRLVTNDHAGGMIRILIAAPYQHMTDYWNPSLAST